MNYFTGILEDDCYTMYMYLEILPLHNSGNRAKLNNGKSPKSNVYGTTTFKSNNGQPRVHSEGKNYYTKLRTEFPEYENIFKEFIYLHSKSFIYNQVVINKNFKITKHKDASNVGESVIIGLGDYQGGELCLESNGKIQTHSIKNQFLKFNGSLIPHWVTDFKGDRYSLVFYNI